ncbi:translocation/assembly module TamB domain-containing protein [Scytonema sp. UIC 10036]|uniref:translocation/assembly module TamB domain-containing protein n=1 Tax=Scytonema sp. UIC 10036 TaxID=2304196 RepID=UPI00325C1500
MSTQPTRGGVLQLNGETQLKTLQTNFKVQAQNVQAADLSRLVELPIILQAGRVDGDLTVQYQPTAQPEIAVTGTANVDRVTAQIQNVPQKFTDASGRLVFQGQQVTLENLSANYGKVPLVANGTVGTQTGFNVIAQTKPVSAKNAEDTLNVNLPVPVEGELQANIKLTGSIEQPVLSGTASTTKPAQIDRVPFKDISTAFRLNIAETASQLAVSNLRLTPVAGGQIVGNGQVQLGRQQNQVNFDFQAQGVPADAIAQKYGFSTPITIGNVTADAQVTGSVSGKQPLKLSLSNVRATPPVGGQITANGQVQLSPQGNVALNIQTQGLPANAIAKAYGISVPINIGGVSAEAKVSGSVGGSQPLEVAISKIQATPPAGGQITANGQVQLSPQGRVSLNVQAQNLPGDAIAKAYNTSPPIDIGNVSANAKVTGTLGNLRAVASVKAPEATYPTTGKAVISQQGDKIVFQDAVVNLAGGTVTARGQVGERRWQAFVDAEQIQLSRFAQIPQQFQGVLSSELNLSGTTTSFQPETIQATGQASLKGVAGGTVNLDNITLNNGRWQAIANVSQLELNQVSEQVRGQLSTNLRVAGTTSTRQLSDIRAAGQVRFSELAPLEQPLTAQIRWNGQQIIVERATAPGLSADGTIALNVPETGTPQIAGFNLDVQAQGYNLKQIPVNLPGNIALAGLLDFNGQVTGTPSSPNARGNIRLRNLNVNGLAFDPLLTGNVNFQGGEGTELQLAGTQDRIAVNLSQNNRPISFFIRRNGTVATGRTEGETLLVNVQDFPVAVLESFIPGDNLNLQPLAGEISGDLAINLDQFTVVGDVAIAQPRVGRATADEFRGRINFADGVATLTDGELFLDDNRISVSGNLQTGNNAQFQTQISFDSARIQKILQAFNIFGYQDLSSGLQAPELAGAEVLQTEPIGLPNSDLLTQLEFFEKIENLVAQQRTQREERQRLPTLAELQGTLTGQIEIAGSLQTGLNADFNLQSAQAQWGEYTIEQFIARGTYADGIVTLLPLRVNLGQGLLAFTGQLGTQELSGQVRVSDLPLSLLQPFIEEYPVDVTGQVNAVATLGGSLEDPQAIGEVTLVDATVNEQPVRSGELSFNYNNARFNFASTVLVAGTQPLEIQGSVPIALPSADTQPDSNQISVTANVQDEGLALLNLFTDAVTWVNGTGQLNVKVGGTLNQPTIAGNATVQNATLQATALTEPLTDVTGTLQFNDNRVIVEGVQGEYEGGRLTAEGVIPIYEAAQAQQATTNNPLTVSLQNLELEVQELYQGDVSGDVVIGGTVLNPEIGGEIRLSDGQVKIGQDANTPPTSATTASEESTEADSSTRSAATTTARSPIPIDFENLRLILGNDVQITTQPLFGDFIPGGDLLSQSILSFETKGDLSINGTLANPRPQGVIRLTGGQVNLFTTQFTLARGYEHTAVFTPSGGLNPVLDVRLVAFVPETTGALSTGSRIQNSPFSAEISDIPAVTSLGTLETVRVEARVRGPASELADNLELTSTPGRSESEIIALLGGSIINTLGQTDSALGIATFAGSTLLSGLQENISAIGQAIGFSAFRVYPTTVANESSRASVLSLAAEGVFDITENFSVSLSRVFLTNESFRYNVLYRVNDDILMRGSTDLEDESRFEIQYETRF